MSTLHRPSPSRVETATLSLNVSWRVRAGSIGEPACSAWLHGVSKKISADAALILDIFVADGDAQFRLLTPAGGCFDLNQLLATLGVEIRDVSVSSDNDGFVHAEVTGMHNGSPINLLRASRVCNSTSGVACRADYAVTQLWSLFQVPGGRYELACK